MLSRKIHSNIKNRLCFSNSEIAKRLNIDPWGKNITRDLEEKAKRGCRKIAADLQYYSKQNFLVPNYQ